MWDAVVILRPGLTCDERKAVVTKVLTYIEKDLDKGVDGGGTIFTATLKLQGDSDEEGNPGLGACDS